MLSDTVVQWRTVLMPLVEQTQAPELFLTLRLIELEVRHMEMTIEYLTGRPHAPLNDQLLSFPAINENQEETINAL
ncbi:hypothetical protein GJU94_02390 [Brucella sp. 10RB9214]|uniref:hypothetical protein n=1 Tax=unclassified Brucella TaxID=2632610 RepID=UPI0012980047|nr:MULTISPECIES: hypothetical protein [unclassified Brucella]MRN48688.1 hypothetical protein [Brucella sp. 10RB9214]QGA56183.1 hypothetical protein GHC20_03375 [Brucella sp. 2280]